jgi:hypothetical protein
MLFVCGSTCLPVSGQTVAQGWWDVYVGVCVRGRWKQEFNVKYLWED